MRVLGGPSILQPKLCCRIAYMVGCGRRGRCATWPTSSSIGEIRKAEEKRGGGDGEHPLHDLDFLSEAIREHIERGLLDDLDRDVAAAVLGGPHLYDGKRTPAHEEDDPAMSRYWLSHQSILAP